MSALRWGIIGCGAVTERKSGPAYQKTPGFELAAVMRRDAALAADYARRHGVPRWFDDADALIADPAIDAVYVATPPDTHLHYALKVAAAGKPCCVEKPMAPSHAECLAMVEAFARAGQPLFVAYYRRSLPRFEQVRRWLAEGRIGAPRHVHWQLARTPGVDDLAGHYRWRTDARIARAAISTTWPATAWTCSATSSARRRKPPAAAPTSRACTPPAMPWPPVGATAAA